MPLIRTLSAAVAVTAVLLSAGCGDSTDSLLTKAKESIAKNDSKAAEIHLKNLLQKEDRAEARYLLGQVHANVGDWRAAEKEFRLAHSGGYEREKSLYALAHALLQAGDVKKALEEASKLAPTTDEQRADTQALMGRIHLAMGKREDAAKAFEKALAVSPNHLNAGLGSIMLRAATDLPGATQALEKLLVTHPNSGDAQQLHGEFLLAAGQRDKALELFKKVAAANPNNRQVRVQIASLVSDDKQYAEAQKWIDELKKLTGPAPMTMYLQALNDLRQGKHEAARDAALQALKVAPEFLQAASVAASAQLALNAFEQAEKHAKLIVEKAPNSTLGYRLLGATYLKMNAPDKALQAVSLPIEKGAKDGSLHAIAGEAALRMNEPAKALGYFKQATELDPKDPARKTGMAIARLASGDRERGMLELEQLATENETGSQADLALISQLLGERKWDEALKAIDRLEKKQPKAPLVANLRGLTLQGKGDAAGARAAFEAALALDPTFFAAVSNLAALDLQAKKPDDAKKRFTTLLEKQPKNINAMLALARISQGQGKAEEKEMFGWLKKAWETDRSSIAASLALSGYYLGTNQAKEAVPVLQEAATAHPERIELLDALGTAYLRAGDDAQAIATFEKVLRTRPDSAQLHSRMGQFYLQRREFERAIPYFKRAIELAPKALEPRAGLASALVGAGKPQEARAIATAIQAEAPRSPAGATLEGDILAATKNWGEAMAAYRRALSLQKTPAILMKLDQVLRVSGRESEANALLKSLLAEAPNDPTVRNYAGMIEIANKRWPEAIAHYKVVLDRSPNHALALNNMAWAQMEMNDPSALSYAERAIAVSPVTPELLDTYGAVLLRQGNAGRAADIMKQAVDLSPKVPSYRLRYAEALIQRGDKADARKQIDILLGDVKSGPYFEQAQQLMKRL